MDPSDTGARRASDAPLASDALLAREAPVADDALLADFHSVVRRILEALPADESGQRLSEALREHLGAEPHLLAVVSAPVPPHRLVDADIALSEVSADDRDATVIGIAGDARHHMSLGDLVQRFHGPGMSVGQVDYDRMPTGPGKDDQRQVVTSGIRLFHFDGHPVAVRQQGMNRQFGRESGTIEVVAQDRDVSDALMARVQELMDERSVIRGQVVTFGSDPYGPGMAGVTFIERPTVDAAAVVLPDGVLDRVAHHVIGMGEHRERLVAHGQHLKRGVLLYGPPGTGKTHTVRYLLSATPGTTAVLLSGGSLRFIHDAAKVARAHQPAIVVLEDCDLVAEDRSFAPMGASPLLFEVLDALDGLDSDSDVAFVLTTNRVEDLEVALSQRPGRVDLAAEIPLPDAEGRRELLRLYGGHLFGAEAISAAAARAEGTTASFAKELVRRAVLAAAVADEPPADDHLGVALDELLSDAQALTRSLLGVGAHDGADGDLRGMPSGRLPRPSRSVASFGYSPDGGVTHSG
ncbi:ATP-binding protein [Terrabacter sp. Root181]|uniref:AAA family ATPase n=1 Tax=Terrabacter sp. Root181 TaxID=1736484 RepID=UPI000AC8A63F|nr:ATP-binding protein [Terrabacter sp. Root181]